MMKFDVAVLGGRIPGLVAVLAVAELGAEVFVSKHGERLKGGTL